MTKQEAILEMKKGIKITHELFDDNEWMTMDGLTIVLEDGVRCSQSEFWVSRIQSEWDNGYSVFNEK